VFPIKKELHSSSLSNSVVGVA